ALTQTIRQARAGAIAVVGAITLLLEPVDDTITTQARVDRVGNRDRARTRETRDRVDGRRARLGDAEGRDQRVVRCAGDALALDGIAEAPPVLRDARTLAARTSAVVGAGNPRRIGTRPID